jgi:hypothetical protein
MPERRSKFSKRFFAEYYKGSQIDSIKIIFTRDLSDMSFDSYGFVAIEDGNKIETRVLDWKLGKLEISGNGAPFTASVKENPKTKKLFLITDDGDILTYPSIEPVRLYLGPIRFLRS